MRCCPLFLIECMQAARRDVTHAPVNETSRPSPPPEPFWAQGSTRLRLVGVDGGCGAALGRRLRRRLRHERLSVAMDHTALRGHRPARVRLGDEEGRGGGAGERTREGDGGRGGWGREEGGGEGGEGGWRGGRGGEGGRGERKGGGEGGEGLGEERGGRGGGGGAGEEGGKGKERIGSDRIGRIG